MSDLVRYQPAFRLKSYICVCNQIGSMNENVLTKLKILAESAKYDVSCASSGTVRSNKPGMLGNTVGGWGSATALPKTDGASPCSKSC